MTTTRVPSASATARSSRRGFMWTVVGIELVVAVNAIWAGIAMLVHPLNPLGITPDLIAGSPFDTYTWPGVLLLVLNGLVPASLAILVILRFRAALLLSAAWGVGLMAWIVAQWLLLSDVLWLQYALFAAGAVVATCGVLAARR
jgi:hypothetical protein